MFKANSYLGFDDRKLRLIGIPLLGLMIPPIFFNYPINGTPDYIMKAVVSSFYTAIYWQVCRYFFIRGNKQFTAIEDTKTRLMWILGLSFLFIFTFCNVIHFCIEPYLPIVELEMPTGTQINAASFVSFMAIAGIYESARNFNLWQKTTVEKEQLEKENLISQLEGLKNQVNPHFLFNSLNTLVNIIPENPDSAVLFVQKLSKVYRYILEIRDTRTTPLSSELDFLKAYVFLLKERFGENLKVEIHHNTEGVAKVGGLEIVPLSLQILFENAIKHNIISTQRPLSISVFIEKNEHLVVRNNLQRKNQVQEGTGVGLQNIKNRYQLVSQKQVEVIMTPQYFTVILPLLKAEKETLPIAV